MLCGVFVIRALSGETEKVEGETLNSDIWEDRCGWIKTRYKIWIDDVLARELLIRHQNTCALDEWEVEAVFDEADWQNFVDDAGAVGDEEVQWR